MIANRSAVVLAAFVALGLAAADAHAQTGPPGGGATVVPRSGAPGAALEPAPPVQQASPTAPTVPATDTPGPSPTASATASPTSATLPLARPILILADSNVEPGAPAPGDQITVRLEVRNVGTVDAENVQLTVSSLVFRAGSQGSVLFKEEIDAQETRPFDLRLQVDSAAAAGVYPLDIALRWEDAAGLVYADQTSLGIQVFADGPAVRPVLVVEDTRVPGRVVAGVPFDIALQVRNGGGSEARNVVLTTSGGPLGPRSASDPTTLAPGASAALSLRVVAADAPEPGAVTQILELRYTDVEGQTYVESVPVGLVIAGDAALGPLPLIAAYSFGDELAPGQVFDLEMEIENVGPTDALATRLVLGGSGGLGASAAASGGGLGVFAPLGTGNVRYLGRLAAGATETVRQRMVVDGAAKPGVYVVETSFEYTDPDGRAQSASGVISLLVSRPVRLEVNPVDVVTRTVVGARVPWSVEIVNAGDATVNVGNAVVEGGRYTDVVDGTVFVGPLDAGAFFPVDATVVAKAPGQAEVTITVSYTDDFRRLQELTATFTLDVRAAPERPAVEMPETVSDTPLWLRILRGFLGLGASATNAPPEPSIGEAETAPPIELEPAPVEAAP